jgi:TPR repeat protein
MYMKKPVLAFIATLNFAIAGPLLAQDLDKGQSAFEAGDYTTALKELKPNAEQGFAEAQYNLGWMYDNGDGVPQDYAEALKWYTLAAEQGDTMAQFNLGVMYDNG